METKDNAETEGNKLGGISSTGTDLDPVSIDGGLKSGEEILTAEIAEKLESGVLSVAKAPTLDFGQPVATEAFGRPSNWQ